MNKVIGDGFCISHYARKAVCLSCRWRHECSYATASGLDPLMMTASVGKAVRNIYNHMIESCGEYSAVARLLVNLWSPSEVAHTGGKEGKLVFYDADKNVASLTCNPVSAKFKMDFCGRKMSLIVTPGKIQESLEEIRRLLE